MKLQALLTASLLCLRAAALVASAPSSAPQTLELDDESLSAVNLTEGSIDIGSAHELSRRAWNSPNEMMFYIQRAQERSCGPVQVGNCVDHNYLWVVRRDSCDEDACSKGVHLDHAGFSTTQSLCDKPFWSCRVPGAHWNLVLRRVDSPASCEYPSKLRFEARPTGMPYATLHDVGQGGKRVGDCWVERGHSYVKSCNPVPVNMESIVRCAWRL